MKGRFITLEGGEGAGKTTLARHLAMALGREGYPVLRTREPGGSPGAEALRTLLLHGQVDWDAATAAMLVLAARREHWGKTIAPALAAGAWVICDRFSDSTMAYQCAGQGLDVAWWNKIRTIAMPDAEPELTVILDLPVEAGLARAAARNAPDRFEAMGSAFHQRVRQAFRDLAEHEPQRCLLLDAERSPSCLLVDALKVIRERLVMRSD
ncbi:dTMP kinase [Pseudoroseomonas globiformis]|uniref:Thymidylate kinase n=1 Tax=Teichococcus globiformis TaxID=2307229 RepID=A0ABV7FZX2_9PROT